MAIEEKSAGKSLSSTLNIFANPLKNKPYLRSTFPQIFVKFLFDHSARNAKEENKLSPF